MSSLFVPTVEPIRFLKSKTGGRPRKDGSNVVTRLLDAANSSPVYSLGKRSSVALQSQRRRTRWSFVAADSGTPLTLLQDSRCIFPPTRDLPVSAKLPLDVAIASATRYIHETPDIYEPDVVAALAAEELTALHHESEPVNHSGRTLVVIQNPHARLARTLLCFATGQVGQDLNISPFLPRFNTKAQAPLQSRFVPSATAVDSFPTSILQLSSSPVVSTHRLDCGATALLVRFTTGTLLLNVTPNPSFPTLAPPVSTLRAGELPVTATEGRQHVDIQLDHQEWSRAAIVDEGGAVWLWWEVKEKVDGRLRKTMELLKIRDKVDEPHDGFFRIAFGTRQDTVVVLSRSTVVLIDLATLPIVPEPTVILRNSDPSNVFINFDKTAAQRGASLTCAISTKELIWFDDYAPGAPVLRWVHELGDENCRDIDLTIVPRSHFDGVNNDEEQSEVVLLDSPTLSSIQAVQLSRDKPVTFRSLPWSPGGTNQALQNLTVLPFQGSTDHRGCVCVVGSTPDGAIHLLKLTTNTHVTTQVKAQTLPAIKWNDALEFLANRPPETNEWTAKGHARYQVSPARWAWSYINDLDAPEATWAVPSFHQDLRETDSNFEHIMTAADRARDFTSFHDPLERRSGLLRRLHLPDCERELDQLEGFAKLYQQYFPFVAQTGRSLPHGPDPEGSFNVLPHAQARDSLEATRLAMDISLSTSLLWSEELGGVARRARQSTADDMFAAATGQLSLEERPSAQERLCLLQPKALQEFASIPLDFASTQPLLSEWVVGDDARQYRWQQTPDLSQDGSSRPEESRAIRPLPAVRTASLANLQPSRLSPPLRSFPSVPAVHSIPAIASMTSIPHVAMTQSIPSVSSKHLTSRSSPPPVPDDSLRSDFPHTQVERGPFGARPEAPRIARKKAGKKRQGGF